MEEGWGPGGRASGTMQEMGVLLCGNASRPVLAVRMSSHSPPGHKTAQELPLRADFASGLHVTF